MSQAPRNPFETDTNQLGRPAEQGSKTWLWVLGIIGGIFLVGAIVCCGGAFYVANQATGLVAEAMAEEYANDPVILENIGKITESQMAVREAIAASSNDDNEGAMIITIQGDKGSGKIVYRTNNKTQEVSVVLIMDDGQQFDLAVAEETDELDAFADELEGLEEMEAIESTTDDAVESDTVESDTVESGSEPDAE